jgi:hypothetical protein
VTAPLHPGTGIHAIATGGNARGAIGGLIGLAFGWLWLLIGSTAAGEARVPILVAGSVVFATAAWRLVRQGRPGRGRFRLRYYIAAVIAEVAAIAFAQSWLTTHHREDLLFPVVGIIVGLHFIGLWLAWRRDQFLWLTGAMVAINLAALAAPLTQDGQTMLSGFGSSVSLFVALMA